MKDYNHVFKACLKGSKEALQAAYRRSIRALAEFDMKFGPESQPDDLLFTWEWIDGYRVFTVATEGQGIQIDFSDIPGVTECLWALYDYGAAIAQSNDIHGIILSRKELFGIPEDDYEAIEGLLAGSYGTISFDPNNPDALIVE